MAIELQESVRLDYLQDPLLTDKRIRLGILRLDELHPLVSGNKWFKLKENIKAAKIAGAQSLLTFGGAYSNHLLATAAAAQASGLMATGLVHGLHVQDLLTPTLTQCAALGMQLVFLTREAYRQKNDADYIRQLQQQYPMAYIIPEGGNNEAGLSGAGDIAGYIPPGNTLVALAVGTGTTLAGIRNGLDNGTGLLGFPVMKGGAYLQEEMSRHISVSKDNWQLNDEYHFGGFGRYTPSLLDFMNDFYRRHHIPLDFVYTAKMMYGLLELIEKGAIARESHVIAIHTGGLQGNNSISHLLAYS